jgi:hypothetical protein
MGEGEPRQKLDQLLAAFGAMTGMAGLATEDNGVCLLVFDGRTHINLFADPASNDLIAWSNLGELPSEHAAATLKGLLRANLFGNGTRGGTLGMMPGNDDIVLSFRRPLATLDVEVLRDLIELAVETAEALQPVAAGAAAPAEQHHDVPIQLGGIRG